MNANKTKNNPLVLVAVPIFNDIEYLENFLNKIDNQTYKNYIVTFCDDASSEDIASIINKSKHTLISNESNLGIGRSLNAIIENGICNHDIDLITWFGVDDEPEPNYLEKFVEEFENTDIQIICSSFMHWGYQHRGVIHTPDIDYKMLKSGYPLGTSYMFTKDTWLLCGPYLSMPEEDYMFFAKAGVLNLKIHKIDNVLMKYMWRKGSVTGKIKSGDYVSSYFASYLANKYL